MVIRTSRKYPQFQQDDIFRLQDSFRKLDQDDKGYIDEATVIKATQQSERQPYDVVRQALKEVELDSSRRVELDDYVDVSPLLQSFSLHRAYSYTADFEVTNILASTETHVYRPASICRQRRSSSFTFWTCIERKCGW